MLVGAKQIPIVEVFIVFVILVVPERRRETSAQVLVVRIVGGELRA